jgi:hypothetical protein
MAIEVTIIWGIHGHPASSGERPPKEASASLVMLISSKRIISWLFFY